MIKAEDFKWLDRVYHLFHLGSYLCLSGALTDCFLPLDHLGLRSLKTGLGDLDQVLKSQTSLLIAKVTIARILKLCT